MHVCDLTTLFIDDGAGDGNTYLTEKARYLAEHHPNYRHSIIVPSRATTTQPLFRSTVYTLRNCRFFYHPHHRGLTRFRRIKQFLATQAIFADKIAWALARPISPTSATPVRNRCFCGKKSSVDSSMSTTASSIALPIP